MNYNQIKELSDCYITEKLDTSEIECSNTININDVTIDHLIYEQIKQRERQQQEFERPYLRLPLPQYKPEIKKQDEGRVIEIGGYESPEEQERGVVIIDYFS